MTVLTTENRVQYSGDGVSTVFPYAKMFFEQDDVVVVSTNTSTLVDTTRVLGVDYTVSGSVDLAGVYVDGANIIFTTAPTASERITIYRATDITQGTDLEENDDLPANVLERALDKLTIIVQQIADDVERSIKFSVTSLLGITLSLTPEASKFIRWNSAGDGLENADITGLGAIAIPVAINQGGTNATTALNARANLGLVLGTGVGEIPTVGASGKLPASVLPNTKGAGSKLYLASTQV